MSNGPGSGPRTVYVCSVCGGENKVSIDVLRDDEVLVNDGVIRYNVTIEENHSPDCLVPAVQAMLASVGS
jgi:hypothetical protein